MFRPEFVFGGLIGAVWCPEIGGVRVSVTQEAINKIKAMIINGDLRPGARLPKESDLAEQLGLSRNSLREAVRALTLIRILETRQGDGTYVTSLEPSVLLETMSFSRRTSRACVWRGITQAGAIEQTKTGHRATYEALRHGSADLARALATRHISGVEAWLELALEDDATDAEAA